MGGKPGQRRLPDETLEDLVAAALQIELRKRWNVRAPVAVHARALARVAVQAMHDERTAKRRRKIK